MSEPIPLSAKGALAAALRPLTRSRDGDATQNPDTPSVHPAQLLGMLLDIGACMDLDSRLVVLEKEQAGRGRRPRVRRNGDAAASEERSAAITKLREALEVQLDTLESTLERFLGQLSRRTGPMTDAGELFDLLAQNGVPASRRPAAVRAAARAGCSAYHAALTGAAERSRSAFVGVRRDLRGKLGALGEAATQVERLDAVLTWGTHQQRGELFERIGAPMDEHFRDGLAAALEALPASPSSEDLRPWYGTRGWVERHRFLCEDLVRGVFLHERRAVVGLVEAAIEATTEATIEARTRAASLNPSAPCESAPEQP